MKKLFVALTVAAAFFSAPVLGHPAGSYASFGECQAALSQLNKEDREFFNWYFQNIGAGQVNMLNNWECVTDGTTWHIAGQPFGGDNLGNGNGKAAPPPHR